jgi:hypothetical protein
MNSGDQHNAEPITVRNTKKASLRMDVARLTATRRGH